jgi:pimeloyl-ACP methyl ester carboxylesterase
LTGAGRRVIALDNRGHGGSSKLYDPADYHTTGMAGDVRALIAHLRLGDADVMGYSMGARIAAFLAFEHPNVVRSIVLGGLGWHLVDGVGLPESIAEALEAPTPADIADAQGRTFRAFAEQTRSDRRALAACIRGSRQVLTREQIRTMHVRALIAVGSRDDIAGSAAKLAEAMPNAKPLAIPDRDHMLAVGDKVFKAGVLEFLKEQA